MDIKEFIKARIAEVEAEFEQKDIEKSLSEYDAGYYDGLSDAYHVILNSIK